MGTREFLKDIWANLEDNTPRLIFSDWLTEQGDSYGEYIRLQLKIEKLPPCSSFIYSCEELGLVMCPECKEWESLSSQVDKLVPDIPKWIGCVLPSDTKVQWKRGFIYKVDYCSLKDWIEIGPTLVERHPIERIEIHDKIAEPRNSEVVGVGATRWLDCRWFSPSPTFTTENWNMWGVAPYALTAPFLPCDIWEFLLGYKEKGDVLTPFFKEYATSEGAQKALEKACIAWARKKVGI